MRLLFKPILTVFALIAMSTASWATAPEIGSPAPDFTLTDNNGQTHSLSDFRGKNVVLEWTNHECPYVVKHYQKSGNMPALQEKATADDVIWLTINSSAPGKQGHTDGETTNEIIEKMGSKETARLLDPEGTVGKLYDARTTPHMFVINAEGVLAYKGAIDDTPSVRAEDIENSTNYVVAALDALKAGNMPEITQTNPYGCSVKY
jgi:hypothetical protein